MSEKLQLKSGISELNFGYNAKMGVYAKLSSDIMKLCDILFGGKMFGEKNIKQKQNYRKEVHYIG